MEKVFKRKIVGIEAFFLFLIASAILGADTEAQTDNFDSYTSGQFLDGGTDDGGWKDWDNTPKAGAYVTNSQFYNSLNSVDINKRPSSYMNTKGTPRVNGPIVICNMYQQTSQGIPISFC